MHQGLIRTVGGLELKTGLNRWGPVGIVTPLVMLLVLGLRSFGALQPWELAFFDLYLRLRPPLPPDDRIAIVGITEGDVQDQNTPILPDRVYANLIQELRQMQPRAIGLDIYRDVPVQPGHAELQEVFAETDNLIGIAKVLGNPDTEAVAAPPLLEKKGQVGANDVIVEADGRVRRGFAFVPTPHGDQMPSFGVHLALLYLQGEGKFEEAVEQTPEDDLRLDSDLFPPFRSNTGGYVGAAAGGDQILLNYRGVRGEGRPSFEIVPLSDILKQRVPSDWGRDRIILIGAVSESFNDLFLTPYSGGILTYPQPMSGVELQAHLASQILSTVLDNRPPLRSWPDPLEWLWTGLWAGLGATLSWKYRYGIANYTHPLQRREWHTPLRRFLVALLALGFLASSTYLAILQGWWLPVIPPLLAFLGATAVNISYLAYNAGKIRKTFGRYLSNEIIAQLLANPEALKLGGKRQKITILTSDLRGFTALSERFPPEQVVTILNLYLKPMLEVIVAHGGTVNELMGDGILALFGAPSVRPDDAERAVACAIAMQLAMESVNQEMEQNHLPTLEMGIGINTGDCVVGNVGSDLYTEYSAVGSEVNLTFRIETYTTGTQILISDSTLKAIGRDKLTIVQEKKIHPKGVLQEISIYQIMGIGSPYHLTLPQPQNPCFPVLDSYFVLYVFVEGKQLGDLFFKGQLVQLCLRGAYIQPIEGPNLELPSLMSNLKLNLLTFDKEGYPEVSTDFYGKVTQHFPEKQQFYLDFTYKPPEITNLFQKITKF
ncbi:adenylate/guanylate cyclase domain-containing protein [Spirulina sp. CS-785/01]|uniref:CHASE2 domain-containing protein n=1 Tax=Spirulina sp. CS-785/01 TaxID=3021716 RepID=UPI00232BDFD8|nr:adenylate/guanylate cyclase domain-containing protein [Spirulina sp. CS-785/01]MDB9314649.1 adenylate/guanylate cyclase domain-containing protein [Spirulina sp. CS-785/01]